MIYQLETHIAQQLKDFFDNFEFIDKAVIFGSRAKHTANPKSDIDLCIYSLEMSDEQFSKLRFELDELPILYKLDIVHFEKVNKELQDNVEKDGKVLFIKEVKLGDILDVQNGYAFNSKLFNAKKGKQLIRIRDLKNGKKTEIKYNGDFDEKFLVFRGDYLIGMDGDFICYEWKGKPSLLNQRVCRLINFEENIEPKYIFYGINKFLEKINDSTSFVTVKHISSKQIKDINFKLPTLTKQKKIAKVLDRANELITLRKESIKKLDDLSKSIFIDMFGDPVLNSKDWDIVTLDYYGTLSRGKSSHRPRNAPELYNGKYPFIQTGDLSNGNNIYLKDYKQTYSEIGIKQSKLFPINTIGIAIAANIGNTKILKREFYFPDSVVGFITESPEFCVFLIEFYRKKLEERATKTAQKNINLKILNELKVIKVPIILQNKFATIIEKIEEQKALYEQQLKLLEDNFNSLLQRSFS